MEVRVDDMRRGKIRSQFARNQDRGLDFLDNSRVIVINAFADQLDSMLRYTMLRYTMLRYNMLRYTMLLDTTHC